MKRAAWMLGLLLFGLSGNAMASSGPPPGCAAPRAQRAFASGLTSGQTLVQRAWSTLNICESLETFSQTVVDNLQSVTLPPGADDYTVCRVVGTLSGALEEVVAVWDLCATACCAEGNLAGQIYGKMYCDLAIALGGAQVTRFLVEQPVSFCGAEAQACCNSEVASVAQSYEGGLCLPYTQGTFQPSWMQSSGEMCAYRP